MLSRSDYLAIRAGLVKDQGQRILQLEESFMTFLDGHDSHRGPEDLQGL